MSDNEKYRITTPEEKRALACQNIIIHNVFWAVWVGVLPFPFIDMVFITAVLVKMANELSFEYNLKFSKTRAKAFIISLISGLGTSSVAMGLSSIKLLPTLGSGLGAAGFSILAGAVTYAVGRVFVKHFESGGTFLDLDAQQYRAYFQKMYEEGKQVSHTMANQTKPTETSK